MFHLGQGQVEAAVVGRQAGEAARRDGDAVVAAFARDELLLLGPADGVVVEPDELDDRVIGLGPGIGEEDAIEALRRHLHEALPEIDHARMRLVRKGMVVGQAAHLRGRRGDETGFAEADRDAPKARHALDVLLAGIVVDVDALAALDDERADLLVFAGIGDGMEQVGDVAGLGGIRKQGHGRSGTRARGGPLGVITVNRASGPCRKHARSEAR